MPNDGPIVSPDFLLAHSHARSGDSKSPSAPGRLAGALPPSDHQTLQPEYLLQHENHFDPNVYTPEQLQQKQAQGPPIQTA